MKYGKYCQPLSGKTRSPRAGRKTRNRILHNVLVLFTPSRGGDSILRKTHSNNAKLYYRRAMEFSPFHSGFCVGNHAKTPVISNFVPVRKVTCSSILCNYTLQYIYNLTYTICLRRSIMWSVMWSVCANFITIPVYYFFPDRMYNLFVIYSFFLNIHSCGHGRVPANMYE